MNCCISVHVVGMGVVSGCGEWVSGFYWCLTCKHVGVAVLEFGLELQEYVW